MDTSKTHLLRNMSKLNTTQAMAIHQKISSIRYRKRKAYSTALRVFLSYFWLNIKSRFLGKKYYERSIQVLHLKNAERIKKRLLELQGLFIKVGQLISNLSNVLPVEFRKPLEALQDHNMSRPYDEIEATIKNEFGQSPEELFSQFDQNPIAAASIGQVHRAEIDGQQVVVKVQHQYIATIAQADLEILKNLVRIHGYFMNMQGLEHTYQQVQQMIEEELDYTKEAVAMQRIAKNLKAAPELNVYVPEVFKNYSSTKVLTTTYYEGVNLAQVETLKSWEIDLEDLAKRLIELYCKMVLVDGYYHADPHPGNILVNAQGDIILLDFGAVARLDQKTRMAIPELIEAVIRNDTKTTTIALRKLGFIGSDKASKQYVEYLINLFREFLQNEVELDGLNFQNIKLNAGLSSITNLVQKVDLRDVSNTIRIPKDYILLNRAIVLLMGDAFLLAPQLDLVSVIRPYMRKHVLKKESGYTKLLINTFKNQLTTAISIPNELSQFLKGANESNLEQEIRGLKTGLQKLYLLGQQFLYASLFLACIYGTPFLNNQEQENQSIWYWVFISTTGILFLRSFYKDTKL